MGRWGSTGGVEYQEHRGLLVGGKCRVGYAFETRPGRQAQETRNGRGLFAEMPLDSQCQDGKADYFFVCVFVDFGCAEEVAAWLFADFVEVFAEVVMLVVVLLFAASWSGLSVLLLVLLRGKVSDESRREVGCFGCACSMLWCCAFVGGSVSGGGAGH